MTVPTRDIINATVERALGYETKRNENRLGSVAGAGDCRVLLRAARSLRRPATGGKRSKPVAERGETSRTIISDRGSRGGLGPSRYPRHGAQRDVIARVETARERV